MTCAGTAPVTILVCAWDCPPFEQLELNVVFPDYGGQPDFYRNSRSDRPRQASARQAFHRRRVLFTGEPTGDALSAPGISARTNVTRVSVARIEAVRGPAKFETLHSAYMAKARAGAVREAIHG